MGHLTGPFITLVEGEGVEGRRRVICWACLSTLLLTKMEPCYRLEGGGGGEEGHDDVEAC